MIQDIADAFQKLLLALLVLCIIGIVASLNNMFMEKHVREVSSKLVSEDVIQDNYINLVGVGFIDGAEKYIVPLVKDNIMARNIVDSKDIKVENSASVKVPKIVTYDNTYTYKTIFMLNYTKTKCEYILQLPNTKISDYGVIKAEQRSSFTPMIPIIVK